MCEHGDTIDLLVEIPADLSHTGKARLACKPIDRCIEPIVRALRNAGIKTRGCCCGHGERDGDIILEDGRTLIIKQIQEDGR